MSVKYLFLVLIFSKIALGSPFGGAITAGSGLSGRAVVDEAEGASQNPALIPFSKGYHIRVTGLKDGGDVANSALRLSILDNLPDTAIPASILYSEFRNQQNFTEREFLVNFGNLITERTGLGLGVGYRTRPDLDLNNPEQRGRSQVYAMAGVQHYFTNELSLAGTLEPQNFGIGMSYIFQRLIRLRLDVAQLGEGMTLASGWQTTSSVGGETFMNRWFVLRLGAAQVGSLPFRTTWGLGFMGPRLKLNYAYAPFNILRSSEYAHWLDLSMPVW
jgi:hypothetical protein